MKKKGFTLIELLAVILVIGIISVIAVPVVTNLLKSSRRNAFKTKIYEIEKAAELYYEEELVAKDDSRTYLDLSKTSDKDKLDLKVDIKAGYVDIKENGEIDITALDGEFCGRKSSKEKLVNLLSLDDLYCVLADSNNTTGTTNAGEIIEKLTTLEKDIKDLKEENSTLKGKVQTLESNSSSYVTSQELEVVTTLADPDTQFLNAHPVGSIYVTISSKENTAAKMASEYGGTWEAYGQGRVLVGVGSNGTTNYSTVDSSGGAESSSYTPAGTNSGGSVGNHTLTIAEMPSHSHTLNGRKNAAGFGDIGYPAFTNNNGGTIGNTDQITATGGGGAHNHPFTNPTFTGTAASISRIQPYKTVYMWKRTA